MIHDLGFFLICSGLSDSLYALIVLKLTLITTFGEQKLWDSLDMQCDPTIAAKFS